MGESLFKHHPDGWIYMFHAGEELTCSLAEWLIQEPDYALPDRDGIIMQAYVPGVRHVYNSRESQFPGELPWADGNRYLANIAEYRSNIEAARAAAAAQAQVEASAAAQAAYDALPENEKARRELAVSDIPAIRVIDDLIELLIANGTITEAALPEAAKTKMAERKALRDKL